MENINITNAQQLDADSDESYVYLAYKKKGITAEDISHYKESFIKIKRTRDLDTYLSGGTKEIDMILTYELSLKPLKPKALALEEKKEYWRRKYFRNLKKIGIVMERDLTITTKKKLYFIKLHVPFEILCVYAEELGMKLPFAFCDDDSQPSTDWFLEKLGIPNFMQQDIPNEPPPFYYCNFRNSKLDKFLRFERPEDIFTTRQRHIIMNEILQTMPYGKRSKKEIGVGHLIQLGAFTGAFPLHDGPYEYDSDEDNFTLLNERQILHKYWARWCRWYNYQPLTHVRNYFGEKITFYFAWLGFYTAWLHPPAIVGWCVFVYGINTLPDDIPLKEICNSGKKYQMCPVCDGCNKFWTLSEYCDFYALVYIFDNFATVFFSIFMACWSVLFLQFWNRTNGALACQWSTNDFEITERARAEYDVRCTTYRGNPITGNLEPHFPLLNKVPRMMASIAILIIMIMTVVSLIIGVVIYRMVMMAYLQQFSSFSKVYKFSAVIASTSATAVQLVLIISMGSLYKYLAYIFTDWEMHRTRTEFDDHLVIKVYIFQFVNYYSSVLYVAFVKGKFSGVPGSYHTSFGWRIEECSEPGCLFDLFQLVVIFLLGRQIVSDFKEILQPKMKKFIRNVKAGKIVEKRFKKAWETEYGLPDEEGLFDEYLEMIIQFGFVTVFVVAFPLAPFFALLNNYVEIRLDAQKYVSVTRRPVAVGAHNIGSWLIILNGLTQLSVLSNAVLVAFSSSFLPKLHYRLRHGSLVGYTAFSLTFAPNGTLNGHKDEGNCWYRASKSYTQAVFAAEYYELLLLKVLYVMAFEHVVFGFNKLVRYIIPDTPKDIHMRVEKEKYLAKELMADAHVKDLLV